MDRATFLKALASTALAPIVAGCSSKGGEADAEFANPDYDKDFSEAANPGFQEAMCEYGLFYLPDQGGDYPAYVGDPMPYFEDGVFYIYYLKEGGDSLRHSIYLMTTEDFVHYDEHPGPIVEAGAESDQDCWIGTGSVVKVNETYYLFYTAHAGSEGFEYQEKIFVAEGADPTSFTKKAGWELVPPDELGQKRDFRDPQAYYDEKTGKISLTVTAAQGGIARIVKFTLNADLGGATYDGIILSDPVEAFWNLECSDTFQIGDRCYISYSGQDDTLWYASSDAPYGPFDEPQRIDGKLFYAAKHVDDSENCFMVGWLRRSETPFSTDEVSAWGGNLAVLQVVQAPDGSLSLRPPDNVLELFADRRNLLFNDTATTLEAGSETRFAEALTAYERFLVTGAFTFEGEGDFGFAFDYDESPESYKCLTISPSNNTVNLGFEGGSVHIADTYAPLQPKESHSFGYLQEGSCGVFWIDGVASLAVRLYGVSGKPVRFFSQDNKVEFSEISLFTAPLPQ